jgi:hypothetical protein
MVSAGPLPRHWRLAGISTTAPYNPALASRLLATRQHLRFGCLVSPDSREERIALEIKRQLSSVGIEMSLEAASRAEILRRARNREYEAIIADAISGPTLFRLYSLWHRDGSANWGNLAVRRSIVPSMRCGRRVPRKRTGQRWSSFTTPSATTRLPCFSHGRSSRGRSANGSTSQPANPTVTC